MEEKDITEKLLEDYNDVFADILNVLVFNGEPVINEQDLETDFTRSQYKAGTQIHGQERDVSKYWSRQNIKFALLGLENQSDRDPDAPLRLISYDGASYRDEMNHGDERYLVFTFVLYFGTEHRWGQKSRSLFKRIGFPTEKLRPYANDYHVNVFEIAWLRDETVAKFKSDFRIVADYFVQKRKNKKYIPSTLEMKHVEEVLNLMYAVTGDRDFEDAQNEAAGKELTTMRELFNSVRDETMGPFLETCVEYGVPYDVAVSKLENTYSLSQKEAEKYACKYYPKSKRSNIQPA